MVIKSSLMDYDDGSVTKQGDSFDVAAQLSMDKEDVTTDRDG